MHSLIILATTTTQPPILYGRQNEYETHSARWMNCPNCWHVFGPVLMI